MSKFLRSGGMLDVNDLVIPEDTVEIDIQSVNIADIKTFDRLVEQICKCRPKKIFKKLI